MMLWQAAALAVLVSQAPPQTPAQVRDSGRPPVVGTGIVSGTVTADEPGSLPVRRAVVRLSGTLDGVSGGGSSIDRVAVTDDRGRYAIASLPAGRFYLWVEKGGWVPLRHGAQGPFDGGAAIAVVDGQPVTVDMRLTRGAVIAGRVVDQYGQPQPGVRPVLLQYRTVSGEQRLVRAPMVSMISFLTQTNDLGEYRMAGIAPGTYVVAIQPALGPVAGTTLRVNTDDEIAWARQPISSGPSMTTGSASAPQPGPGVSFAPVYHPGVTDASAAATVVIAAGEQRLGVDFVTVLVPTSQVRGVVVRPDGQPAAGARLSIGRARAAMSVLDTTTSSATADAKGAFTFAAVATGDFVINARGSSQPAPAPPAPGAARPAPVAQTLDLWGTTPVTVGGRDTTGVTLTLQQGMTVGGRLAFEAANNTTPPALGSMRMMMVSSTLAEGGGLAGNPGANMSMSTANPDGTFSFQGLAPGRYALSASGPGMSTSWMQKAVMVGGRNVWHSGGLDIRPGEDVGDITVVMTDQVGEVSGSLLDSNGRPATELYVFVFPTDKSAWTQVSQRMRPPVRPASDGRFRVTPLLPGDYHVVALSRFDPGNLYDTAFLEQVAAASIKITLAEGEKKVQDIRIK